MRWWVSWCEVLIAVGDQRCERMHMVRVLYHWNLIRLTERRLRRKGKRGKRKMEAIMLLRFKTKGTCYRVTAQKLL